MSAPRQLRLDVALLLGIVLLWSCVAGPEAATPGPASRGAAREPNIVLVMLDDLHYDDLGVYGNDFIRTPSIDRLAREGVRFTQFHAAGPVCTPSRVAILTGRYPHRFNLRFVVREGAWRGSGPSRRGIPGSVTTLGELLRGRGYATAHIGKWHVGRYRPEYRRDAKGFGRPLMGIDGHGALPADGSEVRPADRDSTDHLTERAIEYIWRNRGRPFFLNLWYSVPHVPVEPAPRWARRYPDTEMGRYAAMVSQIDENVGRIVAALDELDLGQQTLLFVTSDNGGIEGTHPESELRGFKANLYEGGIRVPMIARWTERTPAGAVDPSFVTGLDLLPTLADLLAIDVSDLPLDGKSFRTALLGEAAPRRVRTVFWEYGGTGSMSDRDTWAVRRDGWKLVFDKHRSRLFDLESDPLETIDLASSRPELLQELTGAYRRWRLDDRRLSYEVEASRSGVILDAGPWSGGRAEGPVRQAVFTEPVGSVSLRRRALFDFHEADFTLGLWLKIHPQGMGPGAVIARQRPGWSLEVGDDRKVFLTVTGDTTGRVVLESGDRLEPGRWHHIAFSVYGRLHDTSLVRLYLDGEPQARDDSLVAVRSSAEAIVIGGDAARPLRGEVRDLRLYLMALTEREAWKIYVEGAGLRW